MNFDNDENLEQIKITSTNPDELTEFLKNNVLDTYDSLNSSEKRLLWRSIIDYIVINDLEKEDVEIYFN